MANYRFGAILGRGGFGVVREATRVEDNWPCAVKSLSEDCTADEAARFKREVRLQLQLDHPNVVPIVGVRLSATPLWFAMPRAKSNLRKHLENSSGNEIELFTQILGAVAHAHANGVIHRDLKPENVLILENERGETYAAVSDFGLGRFLDRDSTTITQSNAPLGTIPYMAPEQWTDAKSADERSDIYALGKLLYEILTKKLPYPTLDMDCVPRQFSYIIRKATNTNPEHRYQSISEFANDLDLIVSRLDSLERPQDSAEKAVRELLERGDFSAKRIEKLVKIFCDNVDDEHVLAQVFPRLPRQLIEAIVRLKPEDFRFLLDAYDSYVSGSLAFSYCDVVADFYERVFDATDDEQMRELVLCRLPTLGYDHNRWHVGQVFGRLLARVNSQGTIMRVRDFLKANEDAASWCTNYVELSKIPRALRECFS